MLGRKIKIVKEDGGVLLNEDAAIEALNRSVDIKNVYLESNVEKVNHLLEELGIEDVFPQEQVIDHTERRNTWNFPQEYKTIDLEKYFTELCETPEQIERVLYELVMFKNRNMENLLRFCLYFMDVVNTKNIFIGLGRGSSTSCYCLYLIKMHLVDSLKYNLDPVEFFKQR